MKNTKKPCIFVKLNIVCLKSSIKYDSCRVLHVMDKWERLALLMMEFCDTVKNDKGPQTRGSVNRKRPHFRRFAEELPVEKIILI